MVTTSFKVDLIKTLDRPFEDDDGILIFTPKIQVPYPGVGQGHVVRYDISATYANGSTYAS